MSFRPERLNDGSQLATKVPTVVEVTASFGDDPSRVASSVVVTFAPLPRSRVDRAVEAFITALEEGE